ncbi:alpha/beta fold hydrolase [Arthrobacter woluwensis]|uniref:alpha/beta fold hydrolase n=1 Tax=Arthrobacter woluwensis TaxID=156980 RepID=UPI0011A156B9|nr:alpha/beta fold hydrolase [Arthrobacter woluwensis]
MQIYYLHHAGGLPCVPRNLRAALRTGDSTVTPLRFAGTGSTIEDFAHHAISDLVARTTGRATGPRVLYGHSMGGTVAYEICRQLGPAIDRLIDVVVLAATAPWWLPGVTRPRIAAPGPGIKGRSEQRLVTHLAAVDRYLPCDHDVPDVRVRVLYATRDPLVVPHAALKWESLGWEDLRFHAMESSSHLFHTEIVDDPEERRWESFIGELRSETSPESRRWLQ